MIRNSSTTPICRSSSSQAENPALPPRLHLPAQARSALRDWLFVPLPSEREEVTLFLLAKLRKLTAVNSFAVTLRLLYINARNSAKLAIELAKLYAAEA